MGNHGFHVLRRTRASGRSKPFEVFGIKFLFDAWIRYCGIGKKYLKDDIWKMIKFDLRLWIWIGINNCYTIVFVKYFVNLLSLNMKSLRRIFGMIYIYNEKRLFIFHFTFVKKKKLWNKTFERIIVIMYNDNSDNLKYFSIVRNFKFKIFLFLIILFDKNKIWILIYHYYVRHYYIRYYLFKKMISKNLFYHYIYFLYILFFFWTS